MELPTNTASHETTFSRYYKRLLPDMDQPKNRAATATIFSFLAISLFAWFAVRPTAQTILYLRREIEDKTLLNQKMEEKITALIEAQSSYETVQNRLYLLENALPHTPDGPLLAKQMQNMVLQSQATVSAIQIGQLPLSSEATPGAKLAGSKPVELFPVTAIVGGPYTAIRSVLTNLSGLRRITTIESMSFRTNDAVSGFGNSLEAILRLQSYYSTQ